ncbi:MAG: hypothetical protein J5669_04190 [Bacteroidales bacterium]|nr:hypothetical protein [Bacteroidales bacterium]
MESLLLCRDEEDLDHLEKCIYVAAYMSNCLVIIGIAMSNHAHSAVLASDFSAVSRMGGLIKKRHSQFLNGKYGERNSLSMTNVDIRYLDSDWYVRNALAYIPRNALDAGMRVEDYRWSGYRGMFVNGKCGRGLKRVADMGRREREALFHTHEDLSGVSWVVNVDGGVEPASACDYQYLESAFAHDQAFFLKTIGAVNVAEMQQKLTLNNKSRQTDQQMMSIIQDLAGRWFQKTSVELTPEQKARLLPYIYRNYRTSVPQLARCLQLSREIVSQLLPKSVAGPQKSEDLRHSVL